MSRIRKSWLVQLGSLAPAIILVACTNVGTAASPADVQAGHPSASVANAVAAAPTAQVADNLVPPRKCEIWLDVTTSVDRSTYAAVVRTLLKHLPAISVRDHINQCEIYEFSDSPWSATPYRTFALPEYVEFKYEEPACDPPRKTHAAELFRPAHEREDRLARAACEVRRTTARQRYENELAAFRERYQAELDQALRDVEDALLASSPRDARCTAIADHLVRISLLPSPMSVFSITDGLETCRATMPKIDPPEGDVSLVMLLVDAKKPTATTLAQDFDRRRQVILDVAPWIDAIVPFWRFDPIVLQRNARGRESSTGS